MPWEFIGHKNGKHKKQLERRASLDSSRPATDANQAPSAHTTLSEITILSRTPSYARRSSDHEAGRYPSSTPNPFFFTPRPSAGAVRVGRSARSPLFRWTRHRNTAGSVVQRAVDGRTHRHETATGCALVLPGSSEPVRSGCLGPYGDDDTRLCTHCTAMYDDTNGFLVIRPHIERLIVASASFANGAEHLKEENLQVIRSLGQGTYGTVVECVAGGSLLSRLRPQPHVAVKIIRNVPKYRRAARRELEILSLLHNQNNQSTFCVPLLGAFEHKHHVCMVFPLLDGDLFSALEATRFSGLALTDVRAIGTQLLRALIHLRSLGVIHTDIKPENIMLFSTKLTKTKDLPTPQYSLVRTDILLIDFGSALLDAVHAHPELVATRHYRAPEVLLGLPWSFPIDMWAVGCVLVELATGRQLFSTHANAEHLALIFKFLNIPCLPRHMLRAHITAVHDAGRRRAKLDLLVDAMSGMLLVPARLPALERIVPLDALFDPVFRDLVRGCLHIDPALRLSPEQALAHPFFQL